MGRTTEGLGAARACRNDKRKDCGYPSHMPLACSDHFLRDLELRADLRSSMPRTLDSISAISASERPRNAFTEPTLKPDRCNFLRFICFMQTSPIRLTFTTAATETSAYCLFFPQVSAGARARTGLTRRQ